MNIENLIVTDVLSVVAVHSKKGRVDKTRNRFSYALSFTDEGQITYTHKDKTFISDKSNAVILPKGQTYDIRGDKDGIFPVINFECENFSSDTIVVFPIKSSDSLMKDFTLMKNLFYTGKNKLKIMALFYNMLYGIEKSGITASSPLSKAVEFMENNFSSEISNSSLAEKCHISEEHFRKQFKRLYGTSPGQYIINLRIEKAKQLLSEGFLKINAISEQCGFGNPYHFCRLFKQKTGQTPTEYMKQNKISIL